VKVDWYLLGLTGALVVLIGIFTAISWYAFR